MIFPQRSPEVINLELMPQPPQTRSPNNPWPHWPLVFKAGAWPCGDGCGVSMISVMSWAACLWIFLDTFRCLPHTNISRQFQTYMLAEYFFVMYRGTSNNKSGCYDQERCKKGIKPAWKGICSRLKGGKQLFGAIKSGDCNIGMVNYPKWPCGCMGRFFDQMIKYFVAFESSVLVGNTPIFTSQISETPCPTFHPWTLPVLIVIQVDYGHEEAAPLNKNKDIRSSSRKVILDRIFWPFSKTSKLVWSVWHCFGKFWMLILEYFWVCLIYINHSPNSVATLRGSYRRC